MTFISNKTLKKLWDQNDGNLTKIDKELSKLRSNEETLKKTNEISTFLKQGKILTNEFEPLDVLIVNEIPKFYYKQWQIQIYEDVNLTQLNYVFNLISANLSYNLIWSESVENVLDYYNLGNELRQMGFFSLEGNIIFFNVSVYISNPYNELVITNPEVKLQINISPFLNIKR